MGRNILALGSLTKPGDSGRLVPPVGTRNDGTASSITIASRFQGIGVALVDADPRELQPEIFQALGPIGRLLREHLEDEVRELGGDLRIVAGGGQGAFAQMLVE